MQKRKGCTKLICSLLLKEKSTEKEYWAQRRGQEKLDKLNLKMKEDGITPKETRYQTRKTISP